jgi:hypothetical protein
MLLVFVAFAATGASSATDVRHKLAPCPWDGPTARCTGPAIYMDSIVRYLVNGVRYDIPAAYLTDWPKAEVLATIQANDRGGLPDFAFWMPSKRPELIKTGPPMVLPELRRRGSTWGPDEYPVVVLHPRFVKPNDPDLILPEQRFRNLARVTSGPRDVFVTKYGLQEFAFEKDHLGFTKFRNLPGMQPQLLFRCDAQARYPGCDGDVYFELDELSLYIRFPMEHIGNWKEIVTAARDLIFSWRELSQKS